MSGLQTVLLLGLAFLGVFAEAVIDFPRNWLGAQLNFLPPLVVYAALTAGVSQLALVASVGGLCSDALSGNPLGVSVLPLFWVGLALLWWRDLILRQLPYAQFVLGALASAAVFGLTLVVLLTLGERPLLGWGTFWQMLVAAGGGAGLTPLAFKALQRMQRAFAYQPVRPPPFSPDREIKRGRY